MKKTITILILIILFSFINIQDAKANNQNIVGCSTDSDCYNYYLHIDNYKNTYVNYYIDYYKGVYINKSFKIFVPKTRLDFIQLEYKYITGQLEHTSPYYRTIKLNIALIKHGLEPLYY